MIAMVLLSIANGMLRRPIALSTVTIMKTMGKLPMLRVVYVEEDWIPQVPPQVQLSPPLQSPLSVLRPLLLNVQTTRMAGLIAMDQFITVHGMLKVPTAPTMATAMQTMA